MTRRIRARSEISTKTTARARRPRVFLGIRTQFENIGDALIVRELIQQLARRADITIDLSHCPEDFVTMLDLGSLIGTRQLHSLGKFRLLASSLLARLLGHSTYLFLMPGGRDGEVRTLSYIKSWLSLFLLWLLSTAGIRICHLGVSYDRLGKRHAHVIRARARLLHAHFVRDSGSFELLRGLNVQVDGMIPDLALGLFASASRHHRVSRRIAFSFRVDKYVDQRTDVIAAVDRICATYGNSCEMLFISQVRRDDAFMRELSIHIERHFPGKVRFERSTSSIDQCRQLYSQCDWIISNRLHALLLAMSTGATPLALLNRDVDMKICGVLQSVGLSANIRTFHEDAVLPDRLASKDWEVLATKATVLDSVFDSVLTVNSQEPMSFS